MKQGLINLILALLTVLAPAQGMIVTCLALICIDLITGVLAAHKLKQPITSAGLRRTVAKLLVYESAIILAFLTQKYLLLDSIPASNIAAGFVGIAELTSCLENINVLGGNNLLKAILDKLGSVNQEK